MRRASYDLVPGDPFVFCPIRARRIPVDACLDCPWIDDLDIRTSATWLRCSPPGYWPLRLEVGFASDDPDDPTG